MSSLQERRSVRDAERTSARTDISTQQRKVKKLHRPTKGKKKDGFCGLKWNFATFLLSLGLVLLVLIPIMVYLPRSDKSLSSQLRAITPLPVPKIMELSQFKGRYQEDLFWGTYRPNLYLGIRARIPKSLLAGLMWVGFSNGVPALRHTCETSDNLSQYGWLRHDGLSYGHQEIIDGSLLISTTFVKKRFSSSGYGGDWAVRLSVKDASAQANFSQGAVSLLFYVTDEGGDLLKFWPNGWMTEKETSLVSGMTKGVGHWELHAVGMNRADVHYAGYRTTHMHNMTQLVWQALLSQVRRIGDLHLLDAAQDSSNIAIFQFTSKLPFEVDLVYISGDTENLTDVKKRVKNLSGSKLGKESTEQAKLFEDRFQETFHLQEKALDDRSMVVGRAALSNLLGGIAYFSGQSRIAVPPEFQGQNDEDYWLYWPAVLYTAVPSRSTFPRGFLWDEGFHQLLIRRWDRKISMEIIGHWLDLMNIDGWIPREQILGDEARSKVPDEFVLQHTSNANPPTFFLVLQDFVSDLMKNDSTISVSGDEYIFLKRSFPRLQAWFNWFNTTQIGKAPGSYFWHGRDSKTDRELNPKTLTSGLDDYPRASHPSTDERHVDLWCWMALAAKSMALISRLVGAEGSEYERTAQQLSDIDLLNKFHYDSGTGRYYDYGNHTEKVKLEWKISQDPRTGYMHKYLVRVSWGKPRLRFVPHFGYVSLFPFIIKIIPSDSPILEKHLNLIRDEKLLWTGYGLRSLATTSSIYMKHNTEHDPPYWRGPVWVSLNFLILSSLHHYSKEPGPYKDSALQLYVQLRENLIRNVVNSYFESGYLWEQYNNAAEGRGKGAHPFTGWTSLILLVMAEAY